MKILLWNIEWSDRSSKRGRRIHDIIKEIDPDVVCLTETPVEMMPDGGHAISAHADYGYNSPAQRRKVALWSRTPWTEIDIDAVPDMPGGRYVSGVTNGIRFTGVCIPWRDAHVSTGRKDRIPWQDHKTFLTGLAPTLRTQLQSPAPVCLLGDFNQRIPRQKQPVEVYETMMHVIGPSLTCVTSTDHVPSHALIDHVAIDQQLSARVLQILPKTTHDGVRLSDHEGIVVELATNPSTSP